MAYALTDTGPCIHRTHPCTITHIHIVCYTRSASHTHVYISNHSQNTSKHNSINTQIDHTISHPQTTPTITHRHKTQHHYTEIISHTKHNTTHTHNPVHNPTPSKAAYVPRRSRVLHCAHAKHAAWNTAPSAATRSIGYTVPWHRTHGSPRRGCHPLRAPRPIPSPGTTLDCDRARAMALWARPRGGGGTPDVVGVALGARAVTAVVADVAVVNARGRGFTCSSSDTQIQHK